MAKCEAIDLTLSDGDFIQAKKAIHSFLYQTSVYITTSSFCYIKFLLQRKWFVHVHSNYCILAKSARLIIFFFLHCQKLEVSFAMITSVRVKLFTGSSGKTSLDLSKRFSIKDRLLGLRRMAVLLQDRWSWLPASYLCINSCVKPHYYRSTFRSAFCVLAFTVAPYLMWPCMQMRMLWALLWGHFVVIRWTGQLPFKTKSQPLITVTTVSPVCPQL